MAETFEAVKDKVVNLVSGDTNQQSSTSTSTSGKKIVVVFGATGKQGGSVVESILNDSQASSQFQIRAITRDPNGSKAQKLKSKGVECVAADLEDKASLEQAFKGAYAVWCVTNYWEKMDGELEYQQGKNAADAAKAEGVQHFIFSSLANISEASNGKYTGIHHFDNKNKIELYIRSLNLPATFFIPGFYMSNFTESMLQHTPNGWAINIPLPASTPFPLFDAEDDTGKFVKHILLNRSSLLNAKIFGASGIWTAAEMMSEFAEVFPNAGKTAKHNHVPDQAFKDALGKAGMPENGHEEMLQNMQIMYDDKVGYFGDGITGGKVGGSLEHLELTGKDKPTSWKEYIKKASVFKDVN